MKKLLFTILGIFLFALIVLASFSCKKKDPCDELVNGVYQFPALPENHSTMTSQEVTEYWDLPQDICGCITTEGLIETCLNYPDLRLIMAGSNPQSGYDLLVKARFRGIRELESRPDRGTFLLKKFQTLDPLGYDPNWEPVEIGRYNFTIYNVEIIFSQYANLELLTKAEKITLLESASVIYDKMKSDVENYSLWGLECTTTLSGRLMFQDKYEPFLQVYNENSLVRELITYYGPTSWETVESVNNLSKEYLTYLKNN